MRPPVRARSFRMNPSDPASPARRRLLGIGAAGLAVAGTAARRADAMPPPRTAPGARCLAFENLHTGETLRTVYWEQGRYLNQALRDIEYLLRDFRTGQQHPIDVALLDLLHSMRRQLDCTRPIQLISGYRSPATNAALRARSHGVARSSLHMQGMASDIRIPGRDLRHVRDIAWSLGRGGVGFYPRSNFVHVDVGAVRRWNGV
jgi:uncharacterized protein YcbK (DUF882 family)